MKSIRAASSKMRPSRRFRFCHYASSTVVLAATVSGILILSSSSVGASHGGQRPLQIGDVSTLTSPDLGAPSTMRLDQMKAAMAQGRGPITALPKEVLKRLPPGKPTPALPPAAPPDTPEPTQPPDGADIRATPPEPGSELERDVQLAEQFRDNWLQQFGGANPALPTTGNRWADFAYSIGAILNQLMINPTKKENPSVVGTTVRTGIQLALMLAFGGSGGAFGAHPGPREVYKEDLADQLARQRLDAMENAVREYSGSDQAALFREAKSPHVKAQVAAEAAVKMIAEQKSHYPNALLLNFANPVMQDAGLELIEKAAGQGALYSAFMNERNPRVKSGYIADAYVELLKQLSSLAQSSRGDVASWLGNQGVDLERERRQAEHTVLENLGANGLAAYRELKSNEARSAYFEWAFALEAIGSTSWTFATLTPDNLKPR